MASHVLLGRDVRRFELFKYLASPPESYGLQVEHWSLGPHVSTTYY